MLEHLANHLVGHASDTTTAAYVPEAHPETAPLWAQLVDAIGRIPAVATPPGAGTANETFVHAPIANATGWCDDTDMRDEDAIIVEWRLEGPSVDIDRFGWAEYLEFVNRLVSALEALPDGPSARNILPVQIFGGSVRVSTRMLHRHLTAVRALQRGPTATWTPRQLRRAENLYGWVRRQGAALHVAAPGHASERVAVPAASMNETREATTLPGKVHRVGGKLGKVDIEFDGDGIVACSAGRQLAERLGAHLYQPVFVSGRAWRDAIGRLVAFSIESYSAAPQLVPAAEGVRRLHAVLGSTLDDFDPRSILEERRA